MQNYDDLLKIYEESFRSNYELSALTDYVSKETITYGELAKRIAFTHLLFKHMGIAQGDRVALMGHNSTNWVTIFMASITYGAVIVPILHDFNPHDAQHIINHSGSKLLFVDDSISQHFDYDAMSTELLMSISLQKHSILWQVCECECGEDKSTNACKPDYSDIFEQVVRKFNERYPAGFSKEDIVYPEIPGDRMCVLNYTSGTTGFSKGVMLSYNNLLGNTIFGINSKLHYPGSRALSFLPMAHAYGCAFDMFVPLAVGTHITVLGMLPSPRILVKAMAEIRPSLIICVPLVLEKIYRKMIVPMISKPAMRWVLAVPMLDKAVFSIIRSKLIDAFGGQFEQVIVGGAPLNPEVEDFLHRIKFPFTVGYGMTECAPLISYTHWRKFIPGSSGATLPVIMEAKIDSDDPLNIPGEILVRGMNVMQGYYKNPGETARVLEPDGWLHTGDVGTLGGEDGTTIFIRGRSKTMILTGTGQNIYPEEIEAKLNNMPYVSESLVVERDGRLVALVYPDSEACDADNLTDEALQQIMAKTRDDLNALVAPYEKIHRIQLVHDEFEKTPKRSIKRYLYR